MSAAPQQPAPQESTRGRPRGKRRDRGKKTSVTAERGTIDSFIDTLDVLDVFR